MQLALTGASGFVGKHVIRAAIRRGYEVIAFSRDPSRPVGDCVETRLFSLSEIPDLSGCDAVIHLAGESVMGFWTAEKKERILRSRIDGTRRVVEAMRNLPCSPQAFIAASAIGFYGDRGEADLLENEEAGGNYLAETCRAWEAEARAAEPFCRVVRARIGLVMGREGGALPVLRRLFKWGLGGPIASGQQWMSWIHVEDLASLLLSAVENLEMSGPINATAPWPVRNAEFTQILARVLKRPAVLRAPAFALRLLLREFSHELLDSKRVLPGAATQARFPFRFTELEPALRDLLA